MAYTDDWESLMNGVFGPGGKLRSRPKSDPETPPKQSGGFAELNAVLLDQQRRLDEQLRRQSEQMRRAGHRRSRCPGQQPPDVTGYGGGRAALALADGACPRTGRQL